MLRDQMSGMDRWRDGDAGRGRVEEDEDELMLSPSRPGGEFGHPRKAHTHTHPLIYANTHPLIYVKAPIR
jgi:hypothetical protein